MKIRGLLATIPAVDLKSSKCLHAIVFLQDGGNTQNAPSKYHGSSSGELRQVDRVLRHWDASPEVCRTTHKQDESKTGGNA